jgi:hypothetical protein
MRISIGVTGLGMLVLALVMMPAGMFAGGEAAQAGKQNKGKPGITDPVPSKTAGAPKKTVESAAEYLPEPDLLLQFRPAAKSWARLAPQKDAMVKTGSRLLALPGFKGSLETRKGLRLTLWGIQPELMFVPTLALESMVAVNKSDSVDLDLTLQRGRILLRNLNGKPASLFLRLSNPAKPKTEVRWHVTLSGGAETVVETLSMLPPQEPFFVSPNDPQRHGPHAGVFLIVRQGKVSLQEGANKLPLQAPPGAAYVSWSSTQGLSKPQELKVLPTWALGEGHSPGDLKEAEWSRLFELRRKMLRAEYALAQNVAETSLAGALASFLKSEDGTEAILALRCYAALDDIDPLIGALGTDNAKRGGLRSKAVEVLRRWIGQDRDNDQRLYKAVLARGFSKLEAEDFMTLLHGFSARDALEPRTFEVLINYLDSPKIALRQLAETNLYYDVQRFFPAPIGAKIPYSPLMPLAERRQAQREWRNLMKEGRLPPRSKAPGTDSSK